eukprot:scaffold80865_cov55-Attheya_sp.AAC.4
MAKKGKNGKKSKGKTIKALKTNNSGENGASPSSQSTSKMEMMELPENGWICEKDEAAKAVKCERNEENILRLARAYYKLRQWEKLEALASSALKDDSVSSAYASSKLYRQQLTTWHKEAKDNLSIKTRWNEQHEGFGLEESRLRRLNMDTFICTHETFNNFNILHYAAYLGDIRLLEKAIALGAAIDYPVGEPKEEYAREGEEAPRGATALLIACASLALYGQICALMQTFGIDNKNAYQLANIAKKLELTRTMKTFKYVEDRIRLVHCRCGSRLPWRECHASAALVPGRHYQYYDNTDEQGGEKVLCWRFSPLGDCPCGNNKDKYKSYFKCCWQDASRCQDDSTGQLFGKSSMLIDESNEWCVDVLQKLMEGKGPNDPIFPPSMMTDEAIFSCFRNMPMKEMIKQRDPDGISVLYGWDMKVYVSVMERIENWFQWNDLHWAIPKSELIQRTKEWNKALLQDREGGSDQDPYR